LGELKINVHSWAFMMKTLKLSADELATLQAHVQDYPAAQGAIDQLQLNLGSLQQALAAQLIEDLWTEPIYGERSLWRITIETLQAELCGKEGFLARVQAYTDEPKKATALTALMIYILEQTAMPISPSLATLMALYITKVGLTIFCKYIEPPVDSPVDS
jgi:hypothetical protein